MAELTITGITLLNITEKTGFLGRRIITEEQLRLTTPGGSIYLQQNVLEGTGDSWKLFKARLRENAELHGIPYTDEREQQ